MKDNKVITISFPSINLIGDKVLAEQFIGPAKSQMRILENSMKFQNLSQAIRKVKLNADVYVECVRVFNLSIINIVANSVSSKALKVIEDILSNLYIVFGPYEVKLSLSSVEIAFTPGSSISCSGGCAGEITYVDLLSGGSQVIYGHFTGYSDGALITSGAASGVNSYNQFRYYRHDYRYFKLANNNISNEVFYDGFKIESAFDFYTPFEDAFSEDWDVKEWSKTLKTFMVVARLQEPKDMTGSEDDPFEKYPNIQYYFQAAYNGKEVTWGSSQTLGPYFRYKVVYAIPNHYASKVVYRLHIGFDLWEDDEGDFFAGIMLDSTATLSIYKLNKLTYKMELQTEYTSNVRVNYYTYYDETYGTIEGDLRYTENQQKFYVRLLGYGYLKETDEHVAYWGDVKLEGQDINSKAANFYVYEVLNKSTSEKHFFETKYPSYGYDSTGNYQLIGRAELLGYFWNPLNRTIQFVYDDTSYTFSYNTSWEYFIPPQNMTLPDGTVRYVRSINTLSWAYDFGDFYIGEQSFSQGSSNSVLTTYHTFIDSYEFQVNSLNTLVDYKVDKCVMNFKDSSLSAVCQKIFLEVPYFYAPPPLLPSGDLESFNVGNQEWLKYSSEFIGSTADEGWTAILLSGEDGNNVVHENWIIYKDLETPGNYLAVSSSGIKKTLTGIDRAFFFQYYNEEII